METASEKPRVDIDREQRQGHNSNSILDDEQGKGGQSQYTLLPVCGNRMRLLPTLEDPRVVVQILTHLAGRGRPAITTKPPSPERTYRAEFPHYALQGGCRPGAGPRVHG